MQPTAEQARALELFATGDSLAIEAGAGTGKTSTLVMLAKSDPYRRGQYVAFNKSLVTDSAGKFPATVASNTAHSLAFRAHGYKFKARLDQSARVPSREIAVRLGLSPIETQMFTGSSKTLAPAFLAGLINRSITRFCQSADTEIAEHHIPAIDGLDEAGSWTHNTAVRQQLIPYVRRAWADLEAINDAMVARGTVPLMPYKHEHYLKAWQLSHPKIATDYILFDEAQDASPVIAAIVAEQTHAQRIYVGDSQQEIYAWTGAVNALASVDVVNRTFLTKSFRFGQKVADVANVVLDELRAPLRLTGNEEIESRIMDLEGPTAILTRTNATAVRNLLRLQEAGRDAFLVGGSSDMLDFARAAADLQARGFTAHPQIACFGSWADVQAYVEQDPEGEDLRLLVRLVDDFGTDTIITGLTRMAIEERAEIVISTAHKSKGREWSSVQLANDFPPMEKSGPEAKRLLYVAVTRAKLALDIRNVPDLLDEFGDSELGDSSAYELTAAEEEV